MKKSELQKFKNKLISLKSELESLESISKETAKPLELDQSVMGRLSRMDAMQVQQMAKETTRRRKAQLIRVKVALSRIETGDFGYCLNCEEEINIRRLEIDPSITLCIDCAKK